MSQTPCYAKPSDPLPPAIWVPSGSYRIYRGSPVQMVREMAVGDPPAQTDLSVRESLQRLTNELAEARRVVIQLPWNQPDEVLSALFLHAIMQLGIGRTVPSA
jgi:hypothetical protein